MVFKVYSEKVPCYSDKMFDIEVYLTSSDIAKEGDEKKYYVELHSLSFISAAARFIKFKLPEESVDAFSKDCDEIEELRGWLWETCDNGLKTREEATDFLYHYVVPFVKAVLKEFVRKYELYIAED